MCVTRASKLILLVQHVIYMILCNLVLKTIKQSVSYIMSVGNTEKRYPPGLQNNFITSVFV